MKKIIINEEDFDTNAAVVDDNRLVNYFTERKVYARAGNIYKGRVNKVVGNMNFVFIDIGDSKPGFLSEREYYDSSGVYGSIISAEKPDENGIKQPENVTGLFEKGQETVVQVEKEPYNTKGARLTTNVSLPGYYTVYSPYSRHTGVSRRISDDRERHRLRSIVDSLKKELNGSFGVIIRTQAEKAKDEDIINELKALHFRWEAIDKKIKKLKAPKLLYEEEPIAVKALREHMDRNVRKIVTDSEAMFSAAGRYLEETGRKDVSLEMYEGAGHVFEGTGINSQVEGIYNNIVPFKKGGYMTIDVTEALTVIDINSGKFKGKEDVESSLLALNLNAAKEIARQIILRNIGGLIVIDFIDMEKQENRDALKAAVDGELAKSKMYFRTSKISEFGIMEITRKRNAKRVEDIYFEKCGCCGGRGIVPTRENVCINYLKKIKYMCKKSRSRNIDVVLPKAVKKMVVSDFKKELRSIESRFGKKIVLKEEKTAD